MTETCQLPEKDHRPREYWLDLARAVAIISVSFNHALNRSFLTGTDSLSEYLQMSAPASVLKAFLYAFSRIGVPLFLMITGALLIPRNYEDKSVTKNFIRHNWWQILRTTLIWLFIIFWYMQVFGGSVLRTQGFLPAVHHSVSTLLFINQTTFGSMWYMPMILCLYLMLPLLSVSLKRLGNGYVLSISVIVLIGGFLIPNLNTILAAVDSDVRIDWAVSSRNIFSVYYLYAIVGYWIHAELLKKARNSMLWFVLLLSVVLTTLFQYWIYSTPSSYRLEYSDIGIIVISALLFEFFRRKAASFRRIRKPVTCLARISFGLFFVHICVMEGLLAVITKLLPSITRFPKFIILETGTLLISIPLILITSKIRFFRQYLYLIKE